MSNKIQSIKARLNGIQKTLDNTPDDQKDNQISWSLAENFNEIIKEVENEIPELGDSLPSKIEKNRHAQRFGQAAESFLDLEIFCEQILQLLNTVEE
jgi:hypothetical protein